MKRLFCFAAFAAALLGHTYTAQAAGVEFGVGQTGDSTMTYRLACNSIGTKVGCRATWGA